MALNFPDLGIDWGKARQELHTDLGDVWGKVNSAATNTLGRIADAGQGAGSTLGRIAQAGAGGGNQLARIAQAGGVGGSGLERIAQVGYGGDTLGRIAGYGNYGGGNTLDFFSTLPDADPFANLNASLARSAAQQPATPATPGAAGGGAVPGDASWGNPDTAAIERQLGARGARNAAISAESVQRLANQYGVPVAVVLAVLNQESGYGTDQNDLTANNNFMGLTGTGTRGSVSHAQPDGTVLTFATFNTPEEGLEAAIRNMAGSQYHNLGLGQYLALYLTGNVNGGTDSAGNHTADYVNNAIAIAQGLGLNVNANTVVVRPGAQAGAQPVDASGYAFPIVGFSGDISLHHGSEQGASDLFAPEGTTIVAMRGGKVVDAGWNDLGGWTVTIQGDDGLTYYYAHMKVAPAVAAGQAIGTGVFIGQVGETGNAAGTGAHLHLGIGYGIQNGAGPQGGAGIGYNAVALLQQVYQNHYARR